MEKHDDVDTDIETDRDSDLALDELRNTVKNHEKYTKEVEQYKELANRAAEESKEKRKNLETRQRRLKRKSDGCPLSPGTVSTTTESSPANENSKEDYIKSEETLQTKPKYRGQRLE